MPEAAVEFHEFSVSQSVKAKESRKNLPPELQGVVFDVLDSLMEDPLSPPDRVHKISRTNPVFIYINPVPALEVTFEIDYNNKTIYLLHFAAPVLVARKPIFISYSHKDKEWLDKLKLFLKPLEDQVDLWDDENIKAGDLWREEIKKSLMAARAAILLVSQNFLTSEFISTKELPELLDRADTEGVKIFWIAVSASTYKEYAIEKYQALNDPNCPLDSMKGGECNNVFCQIHDKIKEALAEA